VPIPKTGLNLRLRRCAVTGDLVRLSRTRVHFDWRESKRERRIKAAGAPRVSGGQPVAKELRTAEQLSDMIVGALGISEVDVRVRKDHAFGWQPTVISSPGDSIGYQRRVEEIANRLRFHFDLRE
jgi:hypothetical protein